MGLDDWAADASTADATANLRRRGEVTSCCLAIAENVGCGRRTFVAIRHATRKRHGVGPRDQPPERVQGALGLTVGEVGIAKATEAGAVFPGQAHVARPGDRHLGEFDRGPRVAGRQREVGADHQEQRIPTTGGGARRVRGGSEVDVRLIDPARRAFDHDEHDVGERDGLRLVEGRGEFEGVGSPRSGASQVAPVELDHAE